MLRNSNALKKGNSPNPEPGAGAASNRKKELAVLAAETLRLVVDSSHGEQVTLEDPDSFQKKQLEERIQNSLMEILQERGGQLSQGDKQKVIQQVADEIFGYGPINNLIQDPTITEIMINGHDNIYIEQNGRLVKSEITFRDNEHVSHTINKIVNVLGRRLDESCPAVDARLPDGSRVNAIIPPLSLKGPCVTIRKFSSDPFTAEDLVNIGTLTREMVDFLTACVRSRLNMVVSGGTGSGKTTTLNVLSGFIPDSERIVTIEDVAELQLRHDNLVPLESRPANMEGKGEFSIRQLVINALRMRPDRIVVGEVRGGEALDMLQAMNTGHDGSISTLHANSPRDALARLETMVLMAGMELPLRAVREQIASSVEIIVHQSRLSDGTRKITRISEVLGLEGDTIKLQDIFRFNQEGFDQEGQVLGKHLPTGVIPRCMEQLKAFGQHLEIFPVPDLKEPAYHRSSPGEQDKGREQEKPEEDRNLRLAPENCFRQGYGSRLEDGGEGSGGTESSPGRENPLRLVQKPGESAGGGDPRVEIPREMRVIALPVDTEAGLTRFLKPGDRVDIVAFTPEEGESRHRCRTLENTRVLALENEEEQKRSTLYLAVTPLQAETLACARLQGSFQLLLRPPEE